MSILKTAAAAAAAAAAAVGGATRGGWGGGQHNHFMMNAGQWDTLGGGSNQKEKQKRIWFSVLNTIYIKCNT